MHPIRIGRIVRALRRRRGWRQADLAGRAGVSQQTVSRAERGRIDELSFRALGRILQELEGELELSVRWRGGELDRVIDEAHAHLVAAMLERLDCTGWVAAPEVTYTIGRDRGSIDVLAFQPTARIALVVEVKSELTSAEATLRRHDEKVRLAPAIARARFGWDAVSVSRLLALPAASTARRRVDRHARLFDRTYPLRGRELRAWLAEPAASEGGILFLSVTQSTSDRRELASRRRIRPMPRNSVHPEHVRNKGSRPFGFIDSTV
jgi:transcriptional regulator with XRE-family HTH domain